MTKRSHVADLRGAGRLAIDATRGITNLVEQLHSRISRTSSAGAGPAIETAVRSITALAYASVRGVTRVVGTGLDAALGQLEPAFDEVDSTPAHEALLAALNGVLGDYLDETGNPLALQMQWRSGGRELDLTDREQVQARLRPGPKVAVFVHGLCMNELQWARKGHDYSAALAEDLAYTPVHLRYNSGRHVSTNGRAFAEALEALVAGWPVPIDDLVIVAHSMGGLVARSAQAQAPALRHAWIDRLGAVVFLGTPHHGAPLERGGNWLGLLLEGTPYVAPLGRLGRIRSAGITDLRHGALLDEDWEGRDRFTHRRDTRRPVPLPSGTRHYAVAATLPASPNDLADHVPGDGLVPVTSALGQHPDPRFDLAFDRGSRWIARRTGHMDLLASSAVYERIRRWLGPA